MTTSSGGGPGKGDPVGLLMLGLLLLVVAAVLPPGPPKQLELPLAKRKSEEGDPPPLDKAA